MESTFSVSRQKGNLGRHHHQHLKSKATSAAAAPLLVSTRQTRHSGRHLKDGKARGSKKSSKSTKTASSLHTERTKAHHRPDKITSVSTQTPNFMMQPTSVYTSRLYDVTDLCENSRLSYRSNDDTCSELSLELMHNPPVCPPSYSEAVRILKSKSKWEKD